MSVYRIGIQMPCVHEQFKKLDDPKGEVLSEVKAAFPDVEDRVVVVRLGKGNDAIFVWNGCVYQKHLNFNEVVDYVSSASRAQSRIEAERREIIRRVSA